MIPDMPTIAQLVAVLERIAPARYAEPWDNVGLLLGDPDEPLRSLRALLTIDLTGAVMDEAIRAGAGTIIAYHPPIFSALKAITPTVDKGSLLLRAAREGIAIYSPHTALDAINGGVNDWLLELSVPGGAAGIARRKPIAPFQRTGSAKLVFFTPAGTEDQLVDALSAAGAGVIGAYTNCSFQTPGTGTFLGDKTTKPALGQAGVYEKVAEVRVEMVVPTAKAAAVIAALRASHTYEEPAFDLIVLNPVGDPAIGSGRCATLREPISVQAIAESVRQRLGVARVRVALPEGAMADSHRVSTLGVCPGSGGSLLAQPGAKDLDCFVTGEMTHHDVLAAIGRGTTVILAGHTNTERGYLAEYAKKIKAAMPAAEPIVAAKDRWPIVEL